MIKNLNYDYEEFFGEDGWVKGDVRFVAVDSSGRVSAVNENNKTYYEQNNSYTVIVLDSDIQDSVGDFEGCILRVLEQKEIDKIIENLKAIKIEDDVYNEIVAAFGDYEYEGVTEVIVSSPDEMNAFSAKEGVHSAYINHEDAPIVKFELVEVEEGIFSVVDAWEA